MNAPKYSRLPTSDPGPEFSALDGPSYFSYEIERKKYGSAFSYTGTGADTEPSIHPVGKVAGVNFVAHETSRIFVELKNMGIMTSCTLFIRQLMKCFCLYSKLFI